MHGRCRVLTSDASRASLISMLTVIVVRLLNGMLGAVTPPLIGFGAILSVVGVGMLQSSGSPPDVGDLLNFLSAIFFGVHMLRTEKISRTTRKENYIPLLGYEVCVVALLSMMWFFIEGWLGESHRPWTWDLFSASFVSFPWIYQQFTQGYFQPYAYRWLQCEMYQQLKQQLSMHWNQFGEQVLLGSFLVKDGILLDGLVLLLSSVEA